MTPLIQVHSLSKTIFCSIEDIHDCEKKFQEIVFSVHQNYVELKGYVNMTMPKMYYFLFNYGYFQNQMFFSFPHRTI